MDNTFEVEITDLAFGGKGVGRIDGKVVFVQKALPGQVVRVLPYKKKKDYIEARVIEVVKNSDNFVEPECSFFNVCGGCSIQNLDYEEQLKYKRNWVENSLSHIAGISGSEIRETLPSPNKFYYRNKMEFSFASKILELPEKKINSGATGLGLHLPGRYDTVLNIDECWLQSKTSSDIVNLVRKYALDSGLPAMDIQKNKGFWRYLIIRDSKKEEKTLLNLITNICGKKEEKLIDDLSEIIRKEFPAVDTLIHSIHSGKSHAAIWEDSRLIFGDGFITEKIGGYFFKIDSSTFFQTNSRQVEVLYDEVLKAGEFQKNNVVYDLYSGIGTIPLFISKHVASVVGMELEENSVKAASENAEANNVQNCSFIAGKVRVLIKFPEGLYKKYGRPDVVIADPPRGGMDKKTVERVMKMNPDRIIYVSCNPSTLARDLKDMKDNYSVEYVVPVDMFPHTAHIESVVKLRKIK
ncbi:MAG: 23S rRNA (uracil(1939)-C(5))-methyltransferase RlmD [bacterium]|nr:23S rRNA (uracil(1939)-C(5))-methyltransferase RlmD [bacterium]